MPRWTADILGKPYQQHTIDLGEDPDGEGQIAATVVRRKPAQEPKAAVLYVHGFTDYFFNTDLADFFHDRGLAFYALDLRKCGRSMREGQSPHFVRDLSSYDDELSQALDLVRSETGGLPVYLVAHSTAGLTVSLWLHRLNTNDGGAPGAGVIGVILNSPWFDLQGAPWMRSIGTQVIRVIAQLRPHERIRLPVSEAYGESVHISRNGEWDYDTTLKPLRSFPITFGWLNAVRRGQAQLHRGLDIGVPSLVLRSDKSRFSLRYDPSLDSVDAVLDVQQIARWTGCLGNEITVVPIPGAMHDVFLSRDVARKQAYEVLADWLDRHPA